MSVERALFLVIRCVAKANVLDSNAPAQ